jgi:vancomycin permeability regulator SanA
VTRRRKLLLAAALAAFGAIAFPNAVVLAGGDDGALVAGRADCALVLGAGVRDDGTPSGVLQDRLDEALAVWRSGRVKRILVSGDHASPSYDEPNAMRVYLEAHGVPPAAIFMDHAGLDTYSSVWRARHVFGARTVIIVTQRFHLTRAVWVARSLGMEAEGRAADHHLYRAIVWLEVRELFSRAKAFVDVATRRTPHHAGPRYSLEGDGRVTAG